MRMPLRIALWQKKTLLFLNALPLCFVPLIGKAQQRSPCHHVRLIDIGWTEITATTQTLSFILEALGYDTETRILTIAKTYQSLARNEADIFLGSWIPLMAADIAPYRKMKTVDIVRANLKETRYGLAVLEVDYDAGLQRFKDITSFKNALRSRIHGVEAGNKGNRILLDLISKNTFGLSGFQLIESSEQGMLTAIARAERRHNPILFLGWAPHPMNARFALRYLKGGDDYFGKNLGSSTVFTTTRAGYVKECKNVGRLLKKLVFSLEMESTLMDIILNEGLEPEEAATVWLKANPDMLKRWLKGIKNIDGEARGLEDVQRALGF